MRPSRLVERVVIDARYGLRQLRRSPLTTTIAVSTLAAGIGLNTAVFSLVHAILLRSPSYPEASRLVWVTPFDDHFRQDTWASRADYLVWKQQTHVFEAMTAYGTQDLAFEGGQQATQERVASVGGDFWAITGAQPALGRLFAETEQQAIVLSYELFERRFGARASVIGESVIVSGYLFTVTGVLPRGFRVTFPQQTGPGDDRRELDAFIALPGGHETPGSPIPRTERPAPPWVSVVARLRAGIPVERAHAEMDAVHARLEREYPRPPMLQRSMRVLSLRDKLVEHARLALLVVSGSVIFVLLIAAANVANLLLAQASTRARETAIRVAVGAGRARLITQMLVESLLLALIGGAVGVGVAYVAVPIIVALAPAGVPGIADAGVNGPVLAFTLIITVGTGVLFAWAPVFETRAANLRTVLGDAARSATVKKTRIDGVLISAEVALALILLAGAALMMKSLWRLQVYPAGFSPERTYTMRIPLSGPRYEAFDRKFGYISQLLAGLEATPGVEAAGISASTYHMPVMVQGQALPPGQQPLVAVRMVSPGYLRAMGVSLVRGRWPTVQEEFDAMVVNETFARAMLPNGDPIGNAISGSFVSGTIVGIVADFPYSRLDGGRAPELYYPYQLSPATRSIGVAVRMSASAVSTVRQLVSDVDRTQPVYEFRRLEDSLAASIGPRRFNTLLIGSFALGALMMAVAGTFGVVARTVTRRTREAGVRIALGARPSDVVVMIVRQAMAHTVVGIAVGIPAALGVGRTLRGMLYGVEPYDPAMIAIAAAVLGLSSLVASCLPALRAARVDPLVALRTE